MRRRRLTSMLLVNSSTHNLCRINIILITFQSTALFFLPQSSHSPGQGDGWGSSRSTSPLSSGSYFSVEEGVPLRSSSTAQQNQRIQGHHTSQGSHGIDGSTIIHGGTASPTRSRLTGYTFPVQPQLPQSYQQMPAQSFPRFLHPPQAALDSQMIVQTQPTWDSQMWSPPSQTQIQPLVSLQNSRLNLGQQVVNMNHPYPLIQVSSPQPPHTVAPPIPGINLTLQGQEQVQGQHALISSPTPPSKSENTPREDQLNLRGVLPQNLRGDPFRTAKVKTEMCRDYNKPGGCRFGDKCNYAHGEDQLKNQKLMDLAAAGLVDVEVYRTHVCVSWLATGAWYVIMFDVFYAPPTSILNHDVFINVTFLFLVIRKVRSTSVVHDCTIRESVVQFHRGFHTLSP